MSGSCRSASGRAGSPSKSTIFQPLTVRSVWPRCRSAWICWTRDVGQAGGAVEDPAHRLGVHLEHRHHLDRGVEAGAHRGGDRGLLGGGADAGREVLGEGLVGLAQCDSEPGRLAGEVAADLVGVEVGLGEQVAHAGERQLPAVARRAEELLQHRQLQHLSLDQGVRLQPAEERRDVVGAGPGQHVVHGDVRVAAGGDLAEHLQQAVLAEGHRRVRLLAGEQAGVGRQVEVVAREPFEAQRSGLRWPVERLEEVGHREPVVHRVVGVDRPEVRVVGHPDQRVLEDVDGAGVAGQRHLVVLGPTLGVVVHHRDQLEHEGRPLRGRALRAERPEPPGAGDGEGPPLATEPAGAGEVGGEVRRHAGASWLVDCSWAGRVSRNQ